MGSGRNVVYSKGESQAYAPTYHVVPSMLKHDKKHPDIYDPERGYFHNPTATKLNDAIQGDTVMFKGRKAEGSFTYVIDTNGNVIFGKRANPNNPNGRAPHPTLIGGKHPKVQMAGILHIERGKIKSFDDQSGHFRPSSKSMEKMEAAMRKLYDKNHNLFTDNFTWRNK